MQETLFQDRGNSAEIAVIAQIAEITRKQRGNYAESYIKIRKYSTKFHIKVKKNTFQKGVQKENAKIKMSQDFTQKKMVGLFLKQKFC